MDRKDLRLEIETELKKPENKNKPRKMQAKMFGISASQYNNYINHSFSSDVIIQKLGQYFGQTVDNSEFKPTSRQFNIREPNKAKTTTETRKSNVFNSAMRDSIEAHMQRSERRAEMNQYQQ